ncbi:uncharacterized protein LOC116249883 isoform X2 [Nymphaea colorata]|uniref:uncharacterized protein LOC116249883 isoform X2 n=1 Tax=Nymphaea colorata TaxID=210225 RepID=UPI00129DB328|nr:uncharacterized protein LOC116249883 isoform X2 [Nymphaea colorata]
MLAISFPPAQSTLSTGAFSPDFSHRFRVLPNPLSHVRTRARLCRQMSQFYCENSEINISSEEKDKLVSEVIRYILFKNQQNFGAPIKREELTCLVTKNYHQRSLPSFVINAAREKLSYIFGYELREIQRVRPSSNSNKHSSQPNTAEGKTYVICSKLPSDVYSKYVENKETSHVTGFLFAVISIVHLAGGKISEDNLWHHLRRLGLSENAQNILPFGNVKETLEMLLQQRYLQKTKSSGPEGHILMYELAERALDESIMQGVKDCISQIVKKDSNAT